MTAGSMIAMAEPELMQPIEEVYFEELPPPWESGKKPLAAHNKTLQKPVSTSQAASRGQSVAVAAQPRQSRPEPVRVAQPVKRPTVAHPAATKPAQSVSQAPARATRQTIKVNPVEVLRNSAQQGNINAQYDLAMRYQYGNGVRQSRSEAHRWLEKAAKSGYPKAQYALALFYQQFAPNSQGIKKSLLWMKRAADNGYADAQYSLGMMFMNGKYVYLDTGEAKQWLQKAASQGHQAARLALQRNW